MKAQCQLLAVEPKRQTFLLLAAYNNKLKNLKSGNRKI